MLRYPHQWFITIILSFYCSFYLTPPTHTLMHHCLLRTVLLLSWPDYILQYSTNAEECASSLVQKHFQWILKKCSRGTLLCSIDNSFWGHGMRLVWIYPSCYQTNREFCKKKDDHSTNEEWTEDGYGISWWRKLISKLLMLSKQQKHIGCGDPSWRQVKHCCVLIDKVNMELLMPPAHL